MTKTHVKLQVNPDRNVTTFYCQTATLNGAVASPNKCYYNTKQKHSLQHSQTKKTYIPMQRGGPLSTTAGAKVQTQFGNTSRN
jgi:hypothetical protein